MLALLSFSYRKVTINLFFADSVMRMWYNIRRGKVNKTTEGEGRRIMYIVTYRVSFLDEHIYSEEVDDAVFGNRDVSELSYEDIQNELRTYRERVGCCLPNQSADEFVILSVTKLK